MLRAVKILRSTVLHQSNLLSAARFLMEVSRTAYCALHSMIPARLTRPII